MVYVEFLGIFDELRLTRNFLFSSSHLCNVCSDFRLMIVFYVGLMPFAIWTRTATAFNQSYSSWLDQKQQHWRCEIVNRASRCLMNCSTSSLHLDSSTFPSIRSFTLHATKFSEGRCGRCWWCNLSVTTTSIRPAFMSDLQSWNNAMLSLAVCLGTVVVFARQRS